MYCVTITFYFFLSELFILCECVPVKRGQNKVVSSVSVWEMVVDLYYYTLNSLRVYEQHFSGLKFCGFLVVMSYCKATKK